MMKVISLVMRTALWYFFESVLYTECIAGIIINLLIVAAIFLKWKAAKSLSIGDKILSSLATSRSVFLVHVFITYLSPLLDLWNYTNIQVLATLLVVMMFLHSTNLWFATILCVFYCVKVTNYSWKFLIFLKTKISTLVSGFLLASLLISVSFSLQFGWGVYKIEMENLTNVSKENTSHLSAVVYENSPKLFQMFFICSCPPFLIFLVADCLLLHSLWMHIRRMRSSGSGFRSPNLESHFSVIKSMMVFLVLQVIYFICIGLSMSDFVYTSLNAFWISMITTCSNPSLHSLYIISSSHGLRKTFLSMFLHVWFKVIGCRDART
ncbi:taste receptor type 2 member 40-like [Bufo bufo]|uniref:taste receptor type 2 member 40-like n=1 Tax=Bufo bufo TaxID=8384 RepID=UPI001ABDB33D|nr:taste receptor type 2 member 40-like [Bufo bufo]